MRVSFLLLLLLLQQQGVLAQRSSPTDQCGVASASACNECVCCCGEGLLTYKVSTTCLPAVSLAVSSNQTSTSL
jgi:hypothetical protein